MKGVLQNVLTALKCTYNPILDQKNKLAMTIKSGRHISLLVQTSVTVDFKWYIPLSRAKNVRHPIPVKNNPIQWQEESPCLHRNQLY